MPLKPKLTKYSTAAQLNIIYNAQDIINGAGVAKFYGATHMEVTTEAPYLTGETIKSKSTSYTALVDVSDNGTVVIDLDFDSVLNTARSIKGKVNIIGTMGRQTRAASNQQMIMNIIATLTNATTATDIATATSQTETFGDPSSTGTTQSEVFNILMDVPTSSVIGAGQTLRMTIQLYVVTAGSSQQYVGFGVDPANRNDLHPLLLTFKVIEDADDTLLQMNIPMEIQ